MTRFPAAAPLLAAAVTFALCPLLARLAPRLGLMDEPDAGRKRHGRPIPLVGGIAVALGSLTVFPWADGDSRWAWVLVGAMGTVGLLDDLLGLRPSVKLGLQFLIPAIPMVALLTATGVPWTAISAEGCAIIGAFVVVPMLLANAYNFTDNSNGQCAGLAAIGLGAQGAVFWLKGDPGAAVFPLGFSVAFLGFLPWNYPSARSFLGDCGSHVAGCSAALGALTLALESKSVRTAGMVLGAGLTVCIPLLDFAVAVGGRLLRGQAPWKGDTTHLYHRLVARGLKPAAAVAVLWLAAIVTSAAGVLILLR